MWGSTLRDELPRAEAKAAFSQTDPSCPCDDQVVQHLDPEQLSGLDDLAGHRDIFISYMENHDAPCMLVV
ncbi:MAG: hypothetical protein M3380_16480 [Chloroflexota bacterium]|nr:hypothetical protein [Chloroflexota bacterium]